MWPSSDRISAFASLPSSLSLCTSLVDGGPDAVSAVDHHEGGLDLLHVRSRAQLD